MTWDGTSKTFAATTQVPTTLPCQQVTDVYPQEHQPLPQQPFDGDECRVSHDEQESERDAR